MNSINRRRFLETFASAFAAASVYPNDAVAVSDHHYFNRALGIALKIPSDWVFSSVRAFQKMGQAQILSDEIDPTLEQEIRVAEAPIVVFGRDVPGAIRFAPGGTLYAEHIELYEHETFDELISVAERFLGSALPGYKIKKIDPDVYMSGFQSVRIESEFSFTTDQIAPIPVRNVSVITRRPPFIYTLRLFDSPRTSLIASRDFEEVISEVYYA